MLPGAVRAATRAPGRNLLNGRELPGKVALEVAAGDRLRIETPGGGGWGSGRGEQRRAEGHVRYLRRAAPRRRPGGPGRVSTMMEQLRSARSGPWRQLQRRSLGMGHRRLSIIDLSIRSNQPMVDPELGLALVFNGTIYNYRELRRELRAKGYRFFSDGDSETHPQGLARMGEDCCRAPARHVRLRRLGSVATGPVPGPGPFRHQAPVLVATGMRFRFASNTQALLEAGGVDTGIDPVALHHLFTLHAVVPAPRTLLRGVRKLAPGPLDAHRCGGARRSVLLAAGGDAPGTAPERRRVAGGHPRLPARGGEEAQRGGGRAGGRAALRRAGLQPAGGLLAEAGVSDLRTFSVGFEDTPEESGSEFEYSDLVVERYATRHHKFRVPTPTRCGACRRRWTPWPSPCSGRMRWPSTCSASASPGDQGGAVRPGGGRGLRRLLLVSAHRAETGGSWLERFRKHYFDRDHDEYLRMVAEPSAARITAPA